MKQATTAPDRILRPPEVAEDVLGISVSTLWRMRQRGEFPEPIRLSSQAVGWRWSTIAAWLDEREAENGDDDD